MGVRGALAAIAVALVVVASAATTGRAVADPAITGYPDSFDSLGDSISRGYDASGCCFDQPQNVWSTGTSASVNSVYSRLLAVHPAVSGNNFNDAVSGAVMGDLTGQVQNAIPRNPDMVFILLGANDICKQDEPSMTPVATFQSQFQAAMDALTAGLPDARIAVISIPDIYNLWSILHDDASARNAWQSFGICQALLANPTSTAAADVQRRANVRQRNIDDNTVLHDVCAQYAHCRFDNYLGFNTTFVPSDVSSFDYFHPSVAGQAKIAELAWTNGYDFTETNPPTSGSSATFASNAAQVSLSASDDVGVEGIEYKIDTGPYVTFGAPFNVGSGHSFAWRAVDVNGNIEATHTCKAKNWSWPSGDSDCDGYPDSVGQMNLASETYIGTDPTKACAATAAPNDEGGPDASPMDFNDNQLINAQDVAKFAVSYNKPVSGGPYGGIPGERYDFTGNGIINGQDISKFAPFYNKNCA
jgi:lysophospholipase L1-like esterase